MATETTLNPCVELMPNAVKKLETFFKIAATKDERAFMEIDPEEETIRLNCIDPGHITQTINIITNENGDFIMNGLDRVLQFNVNIKDFNKLLTLNGDKDIKIYPDLDQQSSFDAIRLHISENNVSLKEIFLPIYEAINEDLFDGSINLVNNIIIRSHNTVVLSFDLEFFSEILKDSELFMNERLRWNVTINNKSIESLSIETFDSDTDKTRRIKTNLFQGLHFQPKKINVTDSGKHKFEVLFSLQEIKKLVVSSKIFKSVQVIISEKNPFCILYDTDPGALSTIENTLTGLLAPVRYDNDDNEQEQGNNNNNAANE